MKTVSRCSRTALVALLAGALMAGPALADPQPDDGPDMMHPDGYDHGDHDAGHHDRGRGHNEDRRAFYRDGVGISVGEAQRFARKENLRGYRPLPPGIRRNLRRGHPLPPGIEMRPVPAPMLRHLPPPRPGYEWRVAGSDLVLVAVSSAIIADVLVNVLQ